MAGLTREEVETIIENDVECFAFDTSFQFIVTERNGLLFIRCGLWRRDTYSGKMGWGYGPDVLAPETPRGVVMRCFALARDFAEHEVREGFKYKSQRIVGPHITLEAMWEAAGVIE